MFRFFTLKLVLLAFTVTYFSFIAFIEAIVVAITFEGHFDALPVFAPKFVQFARRRVFSCRAIFFVRFVRAVNVAITIPTLRQTRFRFARFAKEFVRTARFVTFANDFVRTVQTIFFVITLPFGPDTLTVFTTKMAERTTFIVQQRGSGAKFRNQAASSRRCGKTGSPRICSSTTSISAQGFTFVLAEIAIVELVANLKFWYANFGTVAKEFVRPTGSR